MSAKTEHHKNRAVRIVPLHPSIEKELLKLHAEAQEGAEYVFPDIDGDTNLRTTFLKIIARAASSHGQSFSRIFGHPARLTLHASCRVT